MVKDEQARAVLCGTHGKRTARVVCAHLLVDTDRVLGFVDNSPSPRNLQAWCGECERMFASEGGMTPAFNAFHGITIVCDLCFERCRQRHTPIE